MLKILSLFDGCSGLQQSVSKLGWDYEYFASEIDKYSQAVTRYNFPDTHFIGDVTKVKGGEYKDVFLFVAGSPCQDLSIAGKRKGLSGERSGLFWEFVRILKECNPKYFILENVASMSKESYNVISEALGVYPIMIDSARITAQQRKRYYWTNIKLGKPESDIFGFELPKTTIKQPERIDIVLQDILEAGKLNSITGVSKDSMVYTKPIQVDSLYENNGQAGRVYSIKGKSVAIKGLGGGGGGKTGLYDTEKGYRKLTPIEVERAFGIKDNYTQYGVFPPGEPYLKYNKYHPKAILSQKDIDKYTKIISNTQRYKMLGNGFSVPVIEYLLKHTGSNGKI